MPQNKRKPTTISAEDASLTQTQIVALEALLQGATVTEAARRADVHRRTVHRWKREDEDFRATYHRWRQCIREEIRDRLLYASQEAAEVVYEAIAEENDVETAMDVLKGLDLLGGNSEAVQPQGALLSKSERRKRREATALLAGRTASSNGEPDLDGVA